MYELLRSG